MGTKRGAAIHFTKVRLNSLVSLVLKTDKFIVVYTAYANKQEINDTMGTFYVYRVSPLVSLE